MMRRTKKGQIQVTFNWIYIAIAGGIILLFFVGVVVRQKAMSEERLAVDVVQILDTIYVSAGVAENTKNIVDIGGLADYTLYFNCEDGVGEHGIKGRSGSVQNAIDPVFAPREMKATKLITWSMPYKMPFKVIDLLFLSSENTKYYLVGDSVFAKRFINDTEGFNREHLATVEEYQQIDPGKNHNIRIVDLGGLTVQDNLPLPVNLQNLGDGQVSAVVFAPSMATFYKKEGDVWKKLPARIASNPIIIADMNDQQQAAKYAAIFAADNVAYQCNMKKAFKRLQLILEVYGGEEIIQNVPGGKLQELITYYQQNPQLGVLGSDCLGFLTSRQENMQKILASYQRIVNGCLSQSGACQELVLKGIELQEMNEELQTNACIPLY